MSDYIWVSRENALGQFAVDLHRCQRFRVSDPRIHEWADTLCIYYLTPDGRWIKHVGDNMPVNGDEEPWDWGEWYEEAEPVQVAHDMLWRFDGRLPPELEEYREIAADYDRFAAWLDGDPDPEATADNPRPRWDVGTRRLVVGGVAWEAFSREAENQCAILDAFERAGWPESIPNPLDTEEKLNQTIKDFNKKARCSGGPLQFRRDNCRVRWRLASGSSKP
ncbi:hypothetical protein [Tautonia plasticadhaerens]|uniref:Uncharacterized protein n=1 Tax=Tautonia plasticadhaerens TaxID=2527974 RepID=A0A518GZV2_9BACT|nr:hypothetical protein [Tautonia plasticadhaerens]QDV34108.1 hypothetical protein ElP_19900 [Tautonia plasticadhaerens]